MNAMLTRLATTVCVWIAATVALHAAPFAQVELSRHLARGEQALMEITVPSDPAPLRVPTIPAIAGVSITPYRSQPRPKDIGNRQFGYGFQYVVSSYEVGRHTIPPITVDFNGSTITTEPFEFEIFNPDDLQWREATAAGRTFRYAIAFHTLKPKLYEGETTPVEIKLYTPVDLLVEDWGIPEFTQDKVSAWRFQPNELRGQVNLLGRPYNCVTYPSSLAPTKSGKVGIGPATLRLITVQASTDGYGRRFYEPVTLTIPKLELDSIPLPAGAPEGFANAVGNFTLQTRVSETEVREGDPVQVEITVTGQGNLDELRAPKPIDEEGWKIYETSAASRGDERRQSSGTATFKQFIRPLTTKTAVPPYQLVFFDPKDEKYHTVLSDPIPLRVIPTAKPVVPAAPAAGAAAAVPAAKGMPVEQMSDVLDIMANTQPLRKAALQLPFWWGHLVGGAIALYLIVRAIRNSLAARHARNPERRACHSAWRELQRSNPENDASFLRAAGTFIERWLPHRENHGLHAILQQRDEIAFRSPQAGTPSSAVNRSAILNTIRKALPLLLIALITLSAPSAQAAEVSNSTATQAYRESRYDDAMRQWLALGPYDQLSADTLYNIGNCCYKLGAHGHAALYYRRALLRDAAHAEARQNLRFLERQLGSVTARHDEVQSTLALVPKSVWQHAGAAGVWLSVLATLGFFTLQRGSRLRLLCVPAWVIGPILAIGTAVALRYFPDDAAFAPPAQQQVVVANKASLYSAAARTSPTVIEAPQGSLCRIIQQSGAWSYVSFTTGTRGWILSNQLEPLVPTKPQGIPEVAKPKAQDGDV